MLLNVKELMAELGIGRDFAYALMQSKGFPSIRIGKRYFVEKDALHNWLTRNQNKEYTL